MGRRVSRFYDDETKGIISPLVDVLFNLMITMFIFLMIYMAVATPKDEKPLHWVTRSLPVGNEGQTDYQTGIAASGGSSHYIFAFGEKHDTNPRRVLEPSIEAADQRKDSPNVDTPVETGASVPESEGEEASLSPGESLPKVADSSTGGETQPDAIELPDSEEGGEQAEIQPLVLSRKIIKKPNENNPVEEVMMIDGVGHFTLNKINGRFEANIYPNALHALGGRTSLDFHIVVIDQDRYVTSETGDSHRVSDGAAKGDIKDGRQLRMAIEEWFELKIKPVSIKFDPEKQPLTITNKVRTLKGVVGEKVDFSFAPIGGLEPYEFRFDAVLPAGLSLNRKTGNISGTPLSPSAGRYTLEVKDAQSRAGDWEQARDMKLEAGSPYLKENFEIEILAYEKLKAEILIPPFYRIGESVSGSVQVRGGIGKKTFEVIELPPGLEMDELGVISGTALEIGEHRIVIRVRDENEDQSKRYSDVYMDNWRVIPKQEKPELPVFNQGR